MNRSLGLFLLFLLALLLVAAIGAWYLGPSVVSLAFDEERRNSPYYVLSLVANDHSASSGFPVALAELAVADGGQLLWRGATVAVSEGRVQDEWQQLQLFEFPRGGDFVEMLTGTRYREISDAHAHYKRLMLGSALAPDGVPTSGAAVLSLFEVNVESHDFARDAQELAGNLVEFQGALIWNAPLADLESEAVWNHILLFEFTDTKAAEEWLRDPGTVTQRALIRRGAKSTVTLILRSS